jgi:hypothetical protein
MVRRDFSNIYDGRKLVLESDGFLEKNDQEK